MTPQTKKAIWLAVSLLLAITLQNTFADSMRIRGAKPDFTLVVALVGAMFCDGNGGAALGFSSGLFFASLAAPPAGGFGGIIISRTLTGFGVGWLEERLYRESLQLAIPLVACGTLITEAIYFVIAPQPNFAFWLRHTLGEGLYNCVLTLPIYLLLKRLVGRSSELDYH